ncbi:acyl-CoA dehydrogenase family protein [Streptomyces sp. NPDC055092]|uniref:acyl-CoA dehydrogenase family protein n=1 Tax=Streptomyces sp. NPDC059262 TaxID=3346797 RepID=UPI0036994A95
MTGHSEELRDLVRSVADGTRDAPRDALWGRLVELGLHRVGVAEEDGGSGGTLDDLLVVAGALAERGAASPLVEAATADWVLAGCGQLGVGLATLMLREETDAEGLRVVPRVPWGRIAERAVICTPDGLFLADLAGAEVEQGEDLAGEPRDTVVLTAPAARMRTADGFSYRAVRDRLALVRAAAVTGAAHGAYRLTRQYVSEREQFGAPLLKLPAVGRQLALARIALAEADTALSLAGTRPAGVAIAALTASRTATEVARIAHQLHGAVGITQEYPLHALTRRLWAWRDAVAPPSVWARELGARAADAGETGMWTELTAPGL